MSVIHSANLSLALTTIKIAWPIVYSMAYRVRHGLWCTAWPIVYSMACGVWHGLWCPARPMLHSIAYDVQHGYRVQHGLGL